MRFLSVHGRGEETGLFPAASLCEPGEGADAVFTSASTAVEAAAYDLRFRPTDRDFGLLPVARCESVNPWGSELAYGTGAGCGLLRRAGFLAGYLAGEDKRRGLVLENLSATAGVQMEFLRP
jgi:acetyl-CoA acetyltransferase